MDAEVDGSSEEGDVPVAGADVARSGGVAPRVRGPGRRGLLSRKVLGRVLNRNCGHIEALVGVETLLRPC